MPEKLKQPTPEQHEAMRLYADLLGEAKLRITCVEDALNGRILIPGPLLHEMCFLQLRFLCELIALGCLVLHGNIKGPRATKPAKDGKLRKEWSAEAIIEELSALHPAFFPIPHTQAKTAQGFHIEPLKDGFLTKDGLIDLYHTCNRNLHRGNIKKLLKSRQPTQFNFPDVLQWIQKIGKLLSTHMVPLFEEGTLVLVVLRNKNDNDQVQVAFASKPFPEGDEGAGAH